MFTIYLTIINLVLIIIHLYYFKNNLFLIHAYETTINIYLSIFLIIITKYKKNTLISYFVISSLLDSLIILCSSSFTFNKYTLL